MGASFRNTGEIKELCGCDKLTISPKLLEELSEGTKEVPLKLDATKCAEMNIDQLFINETVFRYELNKNKMSTDLLSAGIRKFEEDGEKLKTYIRKALSEKAEKVAEKVDIVQNSQKKE